LQRANSNTACLRRTGCEYLHPHRQLYIINPVNNFLQSFTGNINTSFYLSPTPTFIIEPLYLKSFMGRLHLLHEAFILMFIEQVKLIGINPL